MIRQFQHINKYARWNGTRRETWAETVDRAVDYVWSQVGGKLSSSDRADITNALLNEDACFSMRLIQMAGPALDRCQVGLYNCAYVPCDRMDTFRDTLYILMQGTGCAYSVESRYTNKLPKVAPSTGALDVFVIPDNTEGWCDALDMGLRTWWEGGDIEFDTSLVRPAGSRLLTKGGYASGPGPLVELLDFAREIVRGAVGRRLSTFEVHRIMCKIGKIVQVGGVRRAAMLSLFDPWDSVMAACKAGDYWVKYPELSMANNSAAYRGNTDSLDDNLNALIASGSGEPGIFNALGAIPVRRKYAEFGTNPCGEIVLRPRQFCNLSIAIVRPDDDEAALANKVRVAAIMGTIQSALTRFNYISPEWAANCNEERLLGVDLAGALDAKVVSAPGVMDRLKALVVATNAKYADLLGIPRSAATTCIKPGGNSSERFGFGNSVTGWYARYMLRRVRVNKVDPMYSFLLDQGVPCADDYADPTVGVFTFPKEAPLGAPTRNDRTAIEQLEWWLRLKTEWCEHNPSATIYVKDHEWTGVRAWVRAHFDKIGGIAFLPHSDAVYKQAPLEEITQQEYEAVVARFPSIDWSRFSAYEELDTTVVGQDFACLGGACTI